MKKFITLLTCLLIFVSCEEETDNCEPETSRCLKEDNQEIVQVCNADGNWEEALNCTEIDWACCEVDGGMICLPKNECN